jgi:predicted PurR-regulated permease PerM
MNKIINTFHSGRAIFSLLFLICIILVGAVLKLAASVILPFTIAVLLAFVMYPLVIWLDKHRIPRFVSILLIVIIISAGLYLIGFVVFTSGASILSLYPQYEERLVNIYKWASNFFELSYDEDLSFFDNLWRQLGIRNWAIYTVNTLSNSFLHFLSGAVLVIFFMVFILLEASYFKEKLEIAFEKRADRINRIGHDLMSQVTRYLTAKFFISLANGIIFAVAFQLIGMEFAIVWGVLQFILNFIPNLGSIAGGVIMGLFALIQFWPEPGPVIMVVAVILSVNMILGNFLDPKIVGEHVGISPLMILISLAVWGWIWGFAGMVLSVPMMVIIKIVCENIPVLEPISVLMGTRKSVRARKAEKEKAEEQEKAEE